ncbi:MFS transporter [Phreatobacter sp. AB_2022a]|uniref:MFS transporter n=1 Tax=Phreatobacter sp. AB_2022a TaxID=3003134 RepID=UPI002286D8C8|nr:MFS transporter [Phreatobacter sp. AB_2022a]MCZ0735838.1 MFS transporter [Phreatobacter sp. AB_2022a]
MVAPSQAARPAVRPGLCLVTLCLAVLLAQLDTAVVNLATRPIGDHFGAGVAALQWVLDSYNLTYAVLLMTGGLLADLYGRRRGFMTGVGIFTAASLICALAPSVALLIAGRALAGLGAALMLPASLAIVRVVFTNPAERGRALGIWAACNGLALALGPTVGGLLVDRLGWRSIFLVVVPLGLAALAAAPAYIPESADPGGRSFDLTGQVLGAGALGLLAGGAIALHGASHLALLLFAASLALFILFAMAEARRGGAALVPADLFAAPRFCGAVIATAGMTFGMYGVLFLLPFTWQATGRFEATGAGLALMPMALIFVLVSPFSGRAEAAAGTRAVVAGGLGLISLGLGVIGAGSGCLIAAEAGLGLTGLGMGLATGPLMGAAVGAVPAARSGTASALINVARMAGATIGVALLGALHVVAGEGAAGLRLAMVAGGAVQLACAALAFVLMAEDQSSTKA